MANKTSWKRYGFFSKPTVARLPFVPFQSGWDRTDLASVWTGNWDTPDGTPNFDISVPFPSTTVVKPVMTYRVLVAQIAFLNIGSSAATGPISLVPSYNGIRAATTGFKFNSGGSISREMFHSWYFKIYDNNWEPIGSAHSIVDNPIINPIFRTAQNDGITRPYGLNDFNFSSQPFRIGSNYNILFEFGASVKYLTPGEYDSCSSIIGFGDSAAGDESNSFNIYKVGSVNDPPPNRNCGFVFYNFVGNSGAGWHVSEV